jgi:alpha-tubulin suppressor-like RCC1 family protein
LFNSSIARCWGYNEYGQAGDGTTANSSSPMTDTVSNVGAIAAGFQFTCALLGPGSVQCWGWNGQGQLGDGTMTNRVSPTALGLALPVVARVAAGLGHTCAITASGGLRCWGQGVLGELGDGQTSSRPLPPTADTITGISDVALGHNHTCAVLDTGGVRCWGANAYGQLGDGTTTQRLSPVVVTICGP